MARGMRRGTRCCALILRARNSNLLTGLQSLCVRVRGMMHFFMLLLPALVPSWRFFEAVEASPRVQWAALAYPDAVVAKWNDYRPPPMTMSIWAVLGRLFWNPGRNQALYMVSLAERLTLAPTPHSIKEIFHLISAERGTESAPYLQFRLVFVHRDKTRLSDHLTQDVTYLSRPRPRDTIP